MNIQRSKKKSQAFSLLEIMIVVIIIGIIAATIVPQFIGETHNARVNSAKAAIGELQSAVEKFYLHFDRYPTMEEGLKVLVEAPPGEEGKWRGPYVKQVIKDPWGNEYQ